LLSALPVILSVLLVMILGQVLSRIILTDVQFWQGISKLCYWVLFPAMLFKTIALSDFTGLDVNTSMVVLMIGLFGVMAVMWIAGSLSGLNNADLSSVLQGAFRHNGFMALSIIAGLYGQAGLELGTLCLAALVAPSNVMSVVIMVFLNKRDGKVNIQKLLAKEIMRNPLILAILAGLLAKNSPVMLPDILFETTSMLGQAALPILLMAVGAGIRFHKRLKSSYIALMLALLAKAIIFPALMLMVALGLGMTGLPLTIFVIFGVMPTAVSSYALAKELGGNAELMAEIISMQTIMSLPVLLIWLSFFG